MTIRKIISKNETSLKPTQKVVDFNNKYIKQAIQDLLDTMAAEQQRLDKIYPDKGMGVGLAANQIEYSVDDNDPPAEGFYPKEFVPPNIYIISIRPERAEAEKCKPVPSLALINATFEPKTEEKEQESKQSSYEEGCLSVTGFKAVEVPRFENIIVHAFDINGKRIAIDASGFTARVHQHEIDHGLGKEYLDQLNFALAELEAIQNWIDQHKAKSFDNLPIWIIPKKLQCIMQKPDFAALAIWTQNKIDILNKIKQAHRLVQ